MKKFRSNCPLARSLDLVGDKWTMLVLRDISVKGTATYKDLAAMPEGIATNTLAERLDKLVRAEMLIKTKSEKNKLVFNYQITEKGKQLLPVLNALSDWSINHLFQKDELAHLAY